MAALSDETREEIKQLYYEKGYSARQIAEHFNVSLDATYFAMRRFRLKRRDKQEANAASFTQKSPSFRLKSTLTPSEEKLKALGVALYWAEGYKTEKSKTVDFANSDPAMIKVFLKFLRVICGANENRFRILLYCHNRDKIPDYIRYWTTLTGISRKQFTKPYVAKRASMKGMGMVHGLIHIRYSDKKLLDLIRSWIREYADC